jgi:DNA-binding transcriptional regulator YiaG
VAYSVRTLVVVGTTDSDAVALAAVRRMIRSGEARAIREQARISQAELARSIGASQGAVSHWENGVRMPHGHLALRLLATLVALDEGAA